MPYKTQFRKIELPPVPLDPCDAVVSKQYCAALRTAGSDANSVRSLGAALYRQLKSGPLRDRPDMYPLAVGLLTIASPYILGAASREDATELTPKRQSFVRWYIDGVRRASRQDGDGCGPYIDAALAVLRGQGVNLG